MFDFPIVGLQNRLWAQEEPEPVARLQVTCREDADGNAKGGDGGGRVADNGAIWADVSDEVAILQIKDLLPTITRLRVRHFSDAEVLK